MAPIDGILYAHACSAVCRVHGTATLNTELCLQRHDFNIKLKVEMLVNTYRI